MVILNVKDAVSYCVGGFGEGLDHPECVAWGCDGYAYAGGEGGQLYRIDTNIGSFEEFTNVGTFVGGICQDGNFNLYVCSGGVVKKVDQSGNVSVYSDGTESTKMLTPNYPAFDSNGNLYVSDSGEWGKDNGRMFKINSDGEAQIWSEDIRSFPNGIALSGTGDFLYVVVSLNSPRIERIPILEDGSAGPAELVVELPFSVPDGIAFDTQGNLYISCYRPDRIYRLSVDGELEILVEDYEGTLMAAPTNIAFCGPRRDDLLSANLGRWHISRYELDAIGIPLNYPTIK
tara:strand:- start:659 stop:1522 length:864 start_codon:yes stop_codon:yes gene_type:complete